ncbi:unnamed protein product [Rhodiola kirilowii]
MKAAVMWTTSDFSILGMLGGIKTKGYKACPLCLDEIDCTHIMGRMSYQGHRRWLHRDHDWRFQQIDSMGKSSTGNFPHNYPVLRYSPKYRLMIIQRLACIPSLSKEGSQRGFV